MELEILQEKINKANEKLKKLNVKLCKIQNALHGGKNPYLYDESSLRGCLYDINKCKETRDKLLIKYGIEHKKINNRIPVIEQFLTQWGVRAYEFYANELSRLKEYNEQVKKNKKVIEEKIESLGLYDNSNEAQRIYEQHGLGYKQVKKYKTENFSKIILDLEYDFDWKVKVVKNIEREKSNKRNLLMERVNEITGDVTDVSGLYLGDNGEINGVVIGIKGKASVNTIHAGGYNIQCLHFRVLVKKVGG